MPHDELSTRASEDNEDALTEQTPLLASQIPAGEDNATLQPGSKSGDEDSKLDSRHYRNVTPRQFWLLFGGILFGDLIAFFDSTLMASAHPVITSYFNASNSASWLSTVFYVTSTIFQPLAGRLSDVVGRKPVYLFSIATFFLTTLWCALAQSIGSFIAARAICGLGAGGVVTLSFVLVSDVVKLEYRGIYQSCLNLFYGVGHSMGAALGGILCDKLGWRWAFGVQLPFIFFYFVLAIMTTPGDLGPNLMKNEGKGVFDTFKSFDTAGSVTLSFAITGLILGLNLGGNIYSWSHPIVITSLVVFAISSILLILVERRATRPILPLRYLTTIPMANLMFSNFFGSLVAQTVLFNVPLFLQAVRQFSPTRSGLHLISPLVGVTTTAVLTGFLITWSRRMKWPTVVGALTMLAGASASACLSQDLPLWTDPLLIPWASTGQGFIFPATSIAVLALCPQDEQAVVTTTLGLVRSLGVVLGVAVSSWVLQNALVSALGSSVTGAHKREIIMKVRKSVTAIQTLDPKHRAQVITAYAAALRITFVSGIIFAILTVILILPIRLPRLQKKS